MNIFRTDSNLSTLSKKQAAKTVRSHVHRRKGKQPAADFRALQFGSVFWNLSVSSYGITGISFSKTKIWYLVNWWTFSYLHSVRLKVWHTLCMFISKSSHSIFIFYEAVQLWLTTLLVAVKKIVNKFKISLHLGQRGQGCAGLLHLIWVVGNTYLGRDWWHF